VVVERPAGRGVFTVLAVRYTPFEDGG
jgi:hypothetical protein